MLFHGVLLLKSRSPSQRSKDISCILHFPLGPWNPCLYLTTFHCLHASCCLCILDSCATCLEKLWVIEVEQRRLNSGKQARKPTLNIHLLTLIIVWNYDVSLNCAWKILKRPWIVRTLILFSQFSTSLNCRMRCTASEDIQNYSTIDIWSCHYSVVCTLENLSEIMLFSKYCSPVTKNVLKCLLFHADIFPPSVTRSSEF